MVKYPAQILPRLCQPNHFAQRHPFPDARAEWTADVQARHRLRKPNRVLFPKLQESLKVERSPFLFRWWLAKARRMLRIGNDFQLPRLASNPGLPFLLFRERMRQRL